MMHFALEIKLINYYAPTMEILQQVHPQNKVFLN